MPPKSSKKRAKENENSEKPLKLKQPKKAKCIHNIQEYPLENAAPPSAIDYMTFSPKVIPPDWGSKRVAEAAAKEKDTLARLMGHVTLEFTNVSPATMKELVAPFYVTEAYRAPFQCNVDGEYTADGSFNEKQIQLTKIMDGISAGTLHEISGLPAQQELISHLYALQNPSTSIYDIPHMRLFSRHRYDPEMRHLSVDYYIYFARIVFVLISDEAIKCIMEHIHAACDIKRRTPNTTQPVMLSKQNAELLQLPDFRFSLPGLLKHVESTGYGHGLGPEARSGGAPGRQACGKHEFSPPHGLKVNLYDFQKSTYMWMLDQEKDEAGLNGHFWEEWAMADGGGSLYYFPLGGEFRFDKPPIARGGLLCEEMGLGKTIEVLALILGNPATPSSLLSSPLDTSGKKIKAKIPSRGTLIVVPSTLNPQWWEEIQKRVPCGLDRDDGGIKALNIAKKPAQKEVVASCNVREIIYDDEDNIIERKAWGEFSREAEVEIRELPYVSSGTILTGTLPKELAQFRRVVTKDLVDGHFFKYKYENLIGAMKGNESIETVEVRVEHEESLADMDIVLTTYSKLKDGKCFKMFQNFRWHRIVLDECQEIKVATNQIATQCANLTSERRWMVSGTPLCSKISDLHGELNFLKVWPFCLPNSADGFWELRVDGPWRRKEESALTMLYALLDAVMMRHCKSQRYIVNGAPLIDLPSRTVEWRGFDQGQVSYDEDSYLFAYAYIESFAATSMQRFWKQIATGQSLQVIICGWMPHIQDNFEVSTQS